MKYNGMECYTELPEISEKYKDMYLNSIKKFIKRKYEFSEKERSNFVNPKKMSKNRAFYVQEYQKLIGIPKISNEYSMPKVKKEFVKKDEMCEIIRLSLEVMPEFWFYGLLFIPTMRKEKSPLVICQHGGGGSPEYCCDMNGDNNYSHFSKKMLEKGCIVFAPQILLWNYQPNSGEKFQEYGVSYDRKKIDDELKRFGLSITGLEIYCIMRSIDYLASLQEIDDRKIGMLGLSYGGFLALRVGAFDTRIKCIYDAASFNDRYKVFLSDWIWQNDAGKIGEAELCGLCCPRRLILDVGKNDPVFDYVPSIREAERAKLYYEYSHATENFRYHLWDGEHKFDLEHNLDFFFEGLMKE